MRVHLKDLTGNYEIPKINQIHPRSVVLPYPPHLRAPLVLPGRRPPRHHRGMGRRRACPRLRGETPGGGPLPLPDLVVLTAVLSLLPPEYSGMAAFRGTPILKVCVHSTGNGAISEGQGGHFIGTEGRRMIVVGIEGEKGRKKGGNRRELWGGGCRCCGRG